MPYPSWGAGRYEGMQRAWSSRSRFSSATVAISILLLAGWVAWIAPQPDCGPPGLTAVARADRWVPWVFIAAQAVLPSLLGLWLCQPLSRIVLIVMGIGSLAVFLGGAFDIGTALQANCLA